jgi:glutamate-1-semialdehyde 2,1-aminomutase
MPDHALPNLTIEAAWREKTPGSKKLAAEAGELFPSGITHDGRYLKPYGLYVDRAEGAHKWDVDGHRYVDYYGGHGALLLGHAHPEITKAAQAALGHGTHFAAGHPLEVAWARAVQRLMPSAQRVRFTSSGTEATLMAVRLARAFTGRQRIVRCKSHFHGWHDHMTSGYAAHFDGSPTPGVLAEIGAHSVLVEPNDVDAVRALLDADRNIAALILEPTGGSFGMVPSREGLLEDLRELTAAKGVLLILDEVITGFRVAPGGAQAVFGVTPDLTTLAKILAGGLPGGAVAGRADVLALLDFEKAPARGFEKIHHPGTFNANPVSAAAGVAALRIIAESDACARANAAGKWLRGALNEALAEAGVPWAVYGTFSGFHIFTNPDRRPIRATDFDPLAVPWPELKTRQGAIVHRLRLAMLLAGVDFNNWPGGFVSAALGEQDLADTVDGFREALRLLKREGDI